MVEQVEVFRGTSYEDVAGKYNSFMVLNDKKVKKIVDFEWFTDYENHSDNVAIPVDESVKHYVIRLRYESTLGELTG